MGMMKTMHDRPCRLSIRSMQWAEGDSAEEDQLLTGLITEEHGSYVIKYGESTPDDDEVETVVRITEPWTYPRVMVARTGAIVSNMKFAVGERYDFSYSTSMGDFDFSIVTTNVRFTRKSGKYYLSLNYDLITGNSLISNNEIDYSIYPE